MGSEFLASLAAANLYFSTVRVLASFTLSILVQNKSSIVGFIFGVLPVVFLFEFVSQKQAQFYKCGDRNIFI
jgi:hypothetical protein